MTRSKRKCRRVEDEELRRELCRRLLKPEVLVIGYIIRVDGLNVFELNQRLREEAERQMAGKQGKKIKQLMVVKINQSQGNVQHFSDIAELFQRCGGPEKQFKNITIMSMRPGSHSARLHTKIAISPALPDKCVRELLRLLFGRDVPYRYEAYSINPNIIALADERCYAYYDVTKYSGRGLVKRQVSPTHYIFQAMFICGKHTVKASVMFNQVQGVATSTLKLPVGECTAYDIAQQFIQKIIDSGICQVECCEDEC